MSGHRPARKARAVGINHVALEVGDMDEALAFYGRFLEFEIASRSESAAFIYFGDQFINFSKGRRQAPDDDRRLGIAVDDKELVRRTLAEMGVKLLGGGSSISRTRGATGSRSPPARTSGSRRPTTSFAAWGSGACGRPGRPSRSSAGRACRRPDRRVHRPDRRRRPRRRRHAWPPGPERAARRPEYGPPGTAAPPSAATSSLPRAASARGRERNAARPGPAKTRAGSCAEGRAGCPSC